MAKVSAWAPTLKRNTKVILFYRVTDKCSDVKDAKQ